ncbi:MAG: hypothetical protein JSR37_09015 [Verrucomicrobia bacterium]|nr:hypothetical protein [Verrucomicrobiota bacterium]MBS0638122.1 hypothetical protein [Verrucomicrobiota bacterium]
MSTIDAVVLAETLETYYNQKIPFSLLLKTLKEKSALDLKLGELAEFLQERIRA